MTVNTPLQKWIDSKHGKGASSYRHRADSKQLRLWQINKTAVATSG